MTWQTQAEADAMTREGVAKVDELIRTYDGSPGVAREILRGLAAARGLDMDCRPFEDALAKRHRHLSAA